MNYEKQIIGILLAVGERGISISSLTKHVYNQNCTFFFQPDLQEVRQNVKKYLLRNSKSPKSLVEKTGRRGYYRLNARNSAYARQLLLDFSEKEEVPEKPVETPKQDFSLNLFGED